VETATEKAWLAFRDRLLAFIRRRVRSEHDAEDILQDVFVKLEKGLASLEDETRLGAFVFQTARNAIIDFQRRGSASGELLADVAAEPPSAPGANADAAACIRPLLEKLSTEDREALELAELGDLTQAELAARLGISLTGGKSRVQRARRRLGEALRACCDFETDRRGNVISMKALGETRCSR
jgi:RNA polymerase sigma-70 factor (ECF subfamily)